VRCKEGCPLCAKSGHGSRPMAMFDPTPMAATQCQRLLKGGGGGDRKFVSEPPTIAINIAIRAMKTESLKLESNTQRISAPSTTSENGAHAFTHHLLIHICIFRLASIECEEYYHS